MKKWIGIILLSMILVSPAYAYEDGRTERGPLARSGMVFLRGLGNIAGIPMEISSTLIRETEMHSRLWPVTYAPRLVTNIFMRATSAVNDVLLLPWIVPFTDDISPWTEPMGLPTYPWQVHE